MALPKNLYQQQFKGNKRNFKLHLWVLLGHPTQLFHLKIAKDLRRPSISTPNGNGLQILRSQYDFQKLEEHKDRNWTEQKIKGEKIDFVFNPG